MQVFLHRRPTSLAFQTSSRKEDGLYQRKRVHNTAFPNKRQIFDSCQAWSQPRHVMTRHTKTKKNYFEKRHHSPSAPPAASLSCFLAGIPLLPAQLEVFVSCATPPANGGAEATRLDVSFAAARCFSLCSLFSCNLGNNLDLDLEAVVTLVEAEQPLLSWATDAELL